LYHAQMTYRLSLSENKQAACKKTRDLLREATFPRYRRDRRKQGCYSQYVANGKEGYWTLAEMGLFSGKRLGSGDGLKLMKHHCRSSSITLSTGNPSICIIFKAL